MRLSHSFSEVSAVFDDPNLVSCGGLVPVLAMAQRCGLEDLVAGTLTLKAKGGVNAHVKVPGVVAGMVAGADSISDLDLLRHGGMGRLFTGIRAPSTMGTFLRAFTFGHVRLSAYCLICRLEYDLMCRSPAGSIMAWGRVR